MWMRTDMSSDEVGSSRATNLGSVMIALATPNSWWNILSPVIVTAVLLKMTGIPLTEQQLVKKRPGYRDYIERTSAFFPWPPAKEEK